MVRLLVSVDHESVGPHLAHLRAHRATKSRWRDDLAGACPSSRWLAPGPLLALIDLMNIYLIRFFDGTFQSSPSGCVSNPEMAACWRECEAQKALETAAHVGGKAVLYHRDENQRLVPVVIK